MRNTRHRNALPTDGPSREGVARSVIALVVFAAAVCSARAQAPTRLPERVTVSQTSFFATCYDKITGRLKGSEIVRSPMYVSADGKYRAYTENEAEGFNRPEDSKAEWHECVSTARLFVAGPGDKNFRLVFLQRPILDTLDNSLEIIDWSPDSRYLLLELGLGQWGSDFAGSFVILFDAYYHVFWPREFVDQSWIDHKGRRCSSVIGARGFSREGDIVLNIGPYFSAGETEPDPDSCEERTQLWVFDRATRTFTALPQEYKVQRFGRWAKH